MTVEPFGSEIHETTLRHGDYLPQCLVPEFGPDLAAAGTHEVTANEHDTIAVTQSCDLEQRKVRLIAVCPIYLLAEFEAVNPAFAKLDGTLSSPTRPHWELPNVSSIRLELGHVGPSLLDDIAERG